MILMARNLTIAEKKIVKNREKIGEGSAIQHIFESTTRGYK